MRSLRNSIVNVSDVGNSLQAYESLKSNLVEFPSLEHKARRPSVDPSVKVLKFKLTELESIVRHCRERIKSLEKTVYDLNVHVEKLQVVNNALLAEKLDLNSPEISYFLQDVVVHDIKKQLENAYNEKEKHRMDTERIKKRYEAIVQENRRIEGSIKRYRKLVSQNSPHRNSFDSSALHEEQGEGEQEGEGEEGGGGGKFSSRPQKAILGERGKYKQMMLVDGYIKDIVDSGSLFLLFSKFCNAIRNLIGCQKVTVYLLNTELQRLYTKHFASAQYVQKVTMGNVWVMVHTDPSCDVIEPSFSKTEEILKSVKTADKLIQSMLITKDPALVVQCSNPLKPFDHTDEKILTSLFQSTSAATKLILSQNREKALKTQLISLVEVSSNISKSRNHQSLATAVHTFLPKFFECETAGIVFIDEETQESYTLAYSSEPNQLFSRDVVRFPVYMGLTGETYKSKGVQIFDNVKKRNLYNPDIDNIAAAPDLSMSLMSCLKGPNDGIYGVLQLGNKVGGFSEKELRVVSGFSTILGYMAAGICDISEAMDLTIKIREYMTNLSCVLRTDLSELSPDSSGIVDQLEIIKSVVVNWSKRKKAKIDSIS